MVPEPFGVTFVELPKTFSDGVDKVLLCGDVGFDPGIGCLVVTLSVWLVL